MTQRRMPSGQGPSRRPSSSAGRGRATARASTRETVVAARSAATPRTANRPAAARRTGAGATGAAARRTAAPQPRRLTGRATVLVAVLIALALAYTYPIRVYLNQQSDIAEMQSAQSAQRAEIKRLQDEAALWKDPNYIKTQARSRFFMVLPGEELLILLSDPDGAARDAGLPPPGATPPEPDPWYDTLWSSVEAANAESTP
ncbi:septum formation initiator family protein [Asanoa sp. WMMD1127]|uniref:FtsB family cell division protein n=1 Tax=Asanoa sp. WMMD1127 TaxID=3016107 RepID=UPI002417DBA9|nr:septum formation initiator family protein [Asanoa sp. WMMD1127]MDG4821022.1 septum formation initiator family protein [Asanoa sp. WMMD1127]